MKLIDFFKTIKTNLTQLSKNEPLNVVSLAMVIILDIFIVIMLFIGLEEQKEQLLNPYTYVPEVCQEALIDKTWVKEQRLDKINNVFNKYIGFYADKKSLQHPICKLFIQQLHDIQVDNNLEKFFKKRQEKLDSILNLSILIGEKKYLINQTSQLKFDPNYQYQVKEKQRLEELLNKRKNQLIYYETSINESEKIKRLISTIENTQYSQTLTQIYRSLSFWYPFKLIGLKCLFLVPLLLIFYFWHSISLRKTWRLQAFLSSHLLLISAIPILNELIRATFSLFPQHVFMKLTMFLQSIHLLAVWHYLIIMVAIIMTLLFIYILQKNYSDPERVKIKRYQKGQCIQCAMKMTRENMYCPFCSTAQLINCKQCFKPTNVIGNFCSACGIEKHIK